MIIRLPLFRSLSSFLRRAPGALQMLAKFSTVELHAQPCLEVLTTHVVPCHMSQISQVLLKIDQVKLRCLIITSSVKLCNEGTTFLHIMWFYSSKCTVATPALSQIFQTYSFLPQLLAFFCINLFSGLYDKVLNSDLPSIVFPSKRNFFWNSLIYP